ncbi:hypothetical protein EOJ36_01130 [Sandaracinomonas limnophila]|uniref:Uncharacterized protein n=1 Tax=Sandaracinomonas limnophila TaxID=1862386 RepID=A0A437PWI0_9BACT|nr:DUF5686 family protein [Sandaracinomonas limnophila]RVU26627.1 hypothetical protein EOJ36_01130 [Sandaracinomonas limnophila]
MGFKRLLFFFLQFVLVVFSKEAIAQAILADSVLKLIIKNAPYKSSQLKGYSFKASVTERGKFDHILGVGKNRIAKTEGILENKWFGQKNTNNVQVISLNQTQQEVEKLELYSKKSGKPTPFFWPDFYQDLVGPSCVSPFNYFADYYYNLNYQRDTLIQGQKCFTYNFSPKFTTDRLFKGSFIISETGFLVNMQSIVSSDAIDYQLNLTYQFSLNKWLPLKANFKVIGGVLGNNGVFELEENVISEITASKNVELLQIPSKIQEKLNIAERVFDEVFVSQMLGTLHDSMIQKWKQRPETGVETIDSIRYSPNYTILYQENLNDEKEGNIEFDALKTSKFQPYQLIFSKSFFWGERQKDFYPYEIYYKSPLFDSNYNTAEGFVSAAGLVFRRRWSRYSMFEMEYMARHSFPLDRTTGYGKVRFKTDKSDVVLTGGDYVQQYNSEISISPEMNSLATLLLKNNQMKIYRKQFGSLFFNHKFSSKFFVKTWIEYAKRIQMNNITDYFWINYLNRDFTSNNPTNAEYAVEGFADHKAFTTTFHIGFRPNLTYTYVNDERKPELGSSPLFLFKYRAGWKGVGESVADFHHLELSYIHNVEFSPWIKSGIQINTGTFLGHSPDYFIDYKHFNGNYNLLMTGESLASHRLVGYYQNITTGTNQRLNVSHYTYSTGGPYLEALSITQFSNLWLKPFLGTKKAYVKELLIANFVYLQNRNLIYNEIGYGLDGVFKILRLEGIANFTNGKFNYIGFRININTRIRVGNVID